MADTAVKLGALSLSNPVIPASGTFGYGAEFAELYDLNILGSIALKGTTKEPRFGNPGPRIAECPSGMLNSVGLQNPGIEKVLAEELPALAKSFRKPVIMNIAGFTPEEFAYCCSLCEGAEQIGIIELNISCPNVHCGGKNFGVSPDTAYQAVKAARAATTKPLFPKLTPNVADIGEIACACAEAGADGLCLINTVLGMRIDLESKKPVLANGMGGLSGPAILPVAVRCVYQACEAVKLPVIGAGGVSTAYDVIELMLAGASAVEVGAANVQNPFACRDIINALPAVMEKYGISKLQDIIGKAH
jgi:dihydroorotate dehydrogenase (NAD+) catalytic subunit